jgi:5-methylcytosine-specific restriction endonuclease McrA
MIEPRICTLCGNPYPPTTEFFFKQKNGKYGLSSRCKKCHTKITSVNQRKNRMRYNGYSQKHVDTHRDVINARNCKRRREHPEKVRATDRRYREAHPDKVKEVQRTSKRKLRQEQPERVRAYDREYSKRPNARLTDKVNGHAKRARKRAAEGNHTAAQELEQLKRQKGRCYYCGSMVGDDWQPDHVIPLSRGGSNDISNIVITCRKCNNKKLNKLPHEWSEGGRLL